MAKMDMALYRERRFRNGALDCRLPLMAKSTMGWIDPAQGWIATHRTHNGLSRLGTEPQLNSNLMVFFDG
jgi:hypothetical protein